MSQIDLINTYLKAHNIFRYVIELAKNNCRKSGSERTLKYFHSNALFFKEVQLLYYAGLFDEEVTKKL